MIIFNIKAILWLFVTLIYKISQESCSLMIMTNLFHETKQNSNCLTHYCKYGIIFIKKNTKLKSQYLIWRMNFGPFFVNFPKLKEKHKNKEYNLRSIIHDLVAPNAQSKVPKDFYFFKWVIIIHKKYQFDPI